MALHLTWPCRLCETIEQFFLALYEKPSISHNWTLNKRLKLFVSYQNVIEHFNKEVVVCWAARGHLKIFWIVNIITETSITNEEVSKIDVYHVLLLFIIKKKTCNSKHPSKNWRVAYNFIIYEWFFIVFIPSYINVMKNNQSIKYPFKYFKKIISSIFGLYPLNMYRWYWKIILTQLSEWIKLPLFIQRW